MPDKNEKDYANRRLSELKAEWESFGSHYRDLSRFIQPRRGRFEITDRNRGDKRHRSIINSAGTEALRTARAGIMAGALSPSRPWFAFDVMDRDKMEVERVKVWLHLLALVARKILQTGNMYNMSPSMIGEMLLFGTGAMMHVDDFEDVARFYTHTAGSYYLSQNSRYVVDTIYREYQATPFQLIQEFGIDNVSTAVRNQWDNGNYNSWHTVCHLIEPNPDVVVGKLGPDGKAWRSWYFEPKSGRSDNTFLRKSGFSEFPVYAPRWETTGEDVYGTLCPGMQSLGDVKQLQTAERELAKGQAKAHTPPLKGPPSLRNQPIPNIPGGVTLYSPAPQSEGLKPIYEVDPRVQEQLINIQRIERRIERAFYVDLFLAISNMEGVQPKNQLELSQRNEERLLQLGPVLEQIHGEWLERCVKRVARQILDAGIMPPAPPELQGDELQLQFISSLAMAQRAVATSAIERAAQFTGGLVAAGWEGAADKFDADRAVESYGDLIGLPPKLIVPDDVVARRRQEALAQQQRQQQLEMAQQAANVGKMMSDSKLSDENALSVLAGRK